MTVIKEYFEGVHFATTIVWDHQGVEDFLPDTIVRSQEDPRFTFSVDFSGETGR